MKQIRQQHKAREAEELKQLQQELNAKYEAEVRAVTEDSSRATQEAKTELMRVLEERKMSRIVEITKQLRREKEDAENATRARAEAESEKRIRDLVAALNCRCRSK